MSDLLLARPSASGPDNAKCPALSEALAEISDLGLLCAKQRFDSGVSGSRTEEILREPE